MNSVRPLGPEEAIPLENHQSYLSNLKRLSTPTPKALGYLKVIHKTIFWITLCCLILLLLVQSGRCVMKYLEEPTYFSTHIVPQRDADFPALTICASKSGYKDEVLRAHGIEGVKRYNFKKNLQWSSNHSNVSPSELFTLATLNHTELIKRFSVRLLKQDHMGRSLRRLTLANGALTTQYHRGFGRCYTWYPPEAIKRYGIYYITIRMRVEGKVYLHKNGQFLDFNGRMGYLASPNEAYYFQVNFEDLRTLAKEDFGHEQPQKTCLNTHYDQCIYSALERHMLTEAGCVVPYLPSQADICTSYPGINHTFWVAWDRVTNQMDDCYSPCEVISVLLSGKNVVKRNEGDGQFTLYFQPRTLRSQELLLYPVLSLLAEIGGYMGLLLGYSLLHAASLISQCLQDKIRSMEKL